MTVVVPIIAPATVATLSDIIALLISVTLPLLSTLPATLATDVNVPAVSKKSINNNVNTTVDILTDNAAFKSKSNKYVIGGGELTTPLNFAKPVTHAIILKAIIPIIILPFIFSFSSTTIETNAKHPNNTKGFFKSPRVTKVTGWSPTTPIISSPIIAKNNPMPAPIPNFKLFGIELISHALNGVRDIIKNNTPATKTAPRAACGV